MLVLTDSPSSGGDVAVYAPTELAHSFFLLCSYVYFCLYGPFYSISFIQNTRKRLKELILIGPKTVDFISFNKNFPTTLRILALFFWGPVLSVLLNMADHEPIVSVIFSLETPHTVE